MTTSHRAQRIEQDITAHLHSTGVEVTAWEADAWASEIPASQGKLLGWLPAGYTPDGRIEVQFCADVIATLTAHLDDRDLGAFLDVVHLSNATSVVHVDVPVSDRAQIVDDALSRFPGSYRLYVDAQVRALNGTRA